MVESGRVPSKGRICASTKKLCERAPKNGTISVSTAKWQNSGEYREKIESVRIQKNGRISVSTGKWYNLGEYRKKVESMRASKNCLASIEKLYNQCEYRKLVESERVPGKGIIRASTEKLSGRVPKNGRISVST